MGTNNLESIFKEAPPLKPEDQRLVDLYEEFGRPVDDLFYSGDFDVLCDRATAAGDTRSKREIANRLLVLRKAARLPRLGWGPVPGIQLTREEAELLSALVRQYIGPSARRESVPYDHIPYSPEFDALVTEFNRQTGRNLTPHDVWKLVARIAT